MVLNIATFATKSVKLPFPMMKKHVLATAMMVASAVPVTAGTDVALGDSSRVFGLDEVIVVAQPKEQQRLRQQPVSSSMFSGVEMRSLGVDDLRGLSAYTPNFVMPSYGSRYTSAMYVRGIGARSGSPAVGIYVDGMPLVSKSSFNTHLYDIGRVDVLRGPQGTLYGMNTEGGLVRIYSKNPMNYQGTDLKAGWGTHGLQDYQVTHYSRIGSETGLMVGGFFNGQDGFFRNTCLGRKADRCQEAGGRFRLVWRPGTRWDVSLQGDYQYTHQNGFPYGLLDPATGVADAPATNRMGKYRRNILNTGMCINFKGNCFDFNSSTSFQHLNDYMLMDIDYLPQDFMHMEERQRQNALTQEVVLKSNRPSVWHWTLGAFLSTQWLHVDAPVHFDSGMDDFLASNIQRGMQEAMVNAMAGRFMNQPGMTMERAREAAAAAIARAGGVAVTTDLATVPTVVSTPATNLGFFHESNIDLTRRLKATIGVRYDYSYVSIDYASSALMTTVANVMGQEATARLSTNLAHKEHNHFDQLLPKAGLTWQVGPDGSNVYAVVSKGYRAGGYNYQMFSDILQAELQAHSTIRADYVIPHDAGSYARIRQTISYKPETSWNYEAGTHMSLFHGSLLLDLAAFYMQVKDQQLSVMAGNYGFGRMMTNAGESYSCGVEASLRGNAFGNRLSYRLSYGFTHAVFKDYQDSVTVDGTATAVDYKDNKIPFIPMHTLAAAADYRFVFRTGTVRSVTVGAHVNAQGKTWWDEANTYGQKFYAVMGAHAGVDLGCLSLDFWARNLTKTRYNTFAVSSAATGERLCFAQRGNPFQCGVDLRLHL